MRNKLFFGLLIMTSLAVAAPKDIQQVINKGKLIIVLPNINYAPYFSVGKDGKLHGFDINLAKNIAKSFGVKAEFYRKPKTFDGVIAAVSEDKADVAICNISETLPRAKIISYTSPYISQHLALLVNRLWLARQFHKQEWLSSVAVFHKLKTTIGVLAGTSYVVDAKNMFPKAKIVTYSTMRGVLHAVLVGKVDAMFHDEVQIKKFLLERPGAALKLKAIIFRNTRDLIGIAIAFHKPALRRWLNLYLKLKNVTITADQVLTKDKGVKS